MPLKKKSVATAKKKTAGPIVKKTATSHKATAAKKRPKIHIAKSSEKSKVLTGEILAEERRSGLNEFLASNQEDFLRDDAFVGDKKGEDNDEEEALHYMSSQELEDEEEVDEEDKENNEEDRFEQYHSRLNPEYDSQHKFYHRLAEESAHYPKEADKQGSTRSISLYRKIAIRFTFLVLFLIAVVAYFSFVKLTVSIIPVEQKIDDTLIFTVYDKDRGSKGENENAVPGVVTDVLISEEKIYNATGEQSFDGQVIGKVKIKNTTGKNQPLVATTRLLSPDNKLFRISKAVNVPAGGEVEAEIYADEPTAEMAIGPAHFTIPGLNAALQEKIYGDSEEAFIFEGNAKKYILPEDITQAKKDLSLALLAKARQEVGEKFKDFNKVIYNIDAAKIQTESTAKAGDVQEDFKLKASGLVQVVAFSQDESQKLVENKVKVTIPEGSSVLGLSGDSIFYSLEDIDENKFEASVKAAFSGVVGWTSGNEIIDRSKLVNLNRTQIENYLKGVSGVSAFQLKFSPSFISKAPSLADRIKIEVLPPQKGE